MKSVVNTKVPYWLLCIALCSQALSAAWAENSCDCQIPRGGRIQCEDPQLAVCRVQDGKVYGECKTSPKADVEGIGFEAWILSEILQTPIRPEEIEQKADLRRILSEGRYTNPKTGEVVTFRQPKGR